MRAGEATAVTVPGGHAVSVVIVLPTRHIFAYFLFFQPLVGPRLGRNPHSTSAGSSLRAQ